MDRLCKSLAGGVEALDHKPTQQGAVEIRLGFMFLLEDIDQKDLECGAEVLTVDRARLRSLRPYCFEGPLLRRRQAHEFVLRTPRRSEARSGRASDVLR